MQIVMSKGNMHMKFFLILFLLSAPISAPNALAQEDFVSFLNKLDKNNINSISIAVSRLEKIDKKLTPLKHDEIFFKFRAFYYDVIGSLNRNLLPKIERRLYDYPENLSDDNYKKVKDNEIKEFMILLNSNGCELDMTEGGYFIDEKVGFLKDIFTSRVSDSISVFLKMRYDEKQERFFEDAVLLLPLETLGKRIINWENFIERFPNSRITDGAKYFYKTYLGTFVIGFNNSPAFDYEGNLTSERKSAYIDFISKYKESKSARIISDYLKLLEKTDFKYTAEIEKFMSDNDIPETRGVQFHLR
jgi:hypothetical protein